MSLVLGDWGTTRLRLFRMEGAEVAARADGPGIAEAGAHAAAVLKKGLADLGAPSSRVVLCGMAGARGALIEAPYAACPASEAEWAAATARLDLEGIPVRVAAGLKCANLCAAPDVMRGEETQVFGALALQPSLAHGRHLIVHPGTHAKWIELDGGRVARFHTFPTGELFALLSKHSTLLRAGGAAGGEDGGFETGLARAADVSGLIGGLFQTRAAQLLEGRSAGWASAFLSGLLIGEEIRTGLALTGDPAAITLIGDPTLVAHYRRALAPRNLTLDSLDGDDCALAGLARLAEHP